tara:strand:- start:1503 stop:1808 length:306 start_codon:yes stop_codon:yes gene_type:complete
MIILYILEQARRRNAAEQYHLYAQSAEGKAAAEELDRLRAACEQAEANYFANQAKRDAERAERAAEWTEAETKEFGDYRSDEEVAAAYPRRTLWTKEEGRA